MNRIGYFGSCKYKKHKLSIPDKKAPELLTLKKPLSFITEGKVSALTDPRILAAIRILMMVVLYYVFR